MLHGDLVVVLDIGVYEELSCVKCVDIPPVSAPSDPHPCVIGVRNPCCGSILRKYIEECLLSVDTYFTEL